MELNTTNMALIQVKANSALISNFNTNSSHRICNVLKTALPTDDSTSNLDSVTLFLSTSHCHLGHHEQD